MKIGHDLVEIQRIEQAINRHPQTFVSRLFTQKEIAYCQRFAKAVIHFAGRFAAKEAIVKALGTGFREGVSWLDFEILPDAFGKPKVYVSEDIQQQFPDLQIELSISHTETFASAVALISKQKTF